MPTVTETFARKNAMQDLADAVAYSVLKSDDALYVFTKGGFKVANRHNANALRYQGWTLCLDDLSTFLNRTETTDDGQEEAELIAQWMKVQK